MIKNRKVGHIGFGTNDIEATAKWYVDVLGFKVIGEFMSPDNEPIKFLQSGDLVYEIWQPAPGQTVDCPGKIDHLCFPITCWLLALWIWCSNWLHWIFFYLVESFIAVHRLSSCSGRSCSMACDILVT